MNRFCTSLMFVIGLFFTNVGSQKVLFCFYDGRIVDSSGFKIDDINPNLCTHLIYEAVQLDIQKCNVTAPQFIDTDSEKFIGLKIKNPKLKMLFDLHVKPLIWMDNHVKLMTNSRYIDVLVENVVVLLRQYKFDGVVLDFLPIKKEKVGFMNLVNAFKKAFLPASYLLAVTGSIHENQINEGYDIPSLNKDVDFLIVNAFSFYNPLEEQNWASHPSPLYSKSRNTEDKTVNFSINSWINRGISRNKILLSIPLFGLSWILSKNQTTPPAPAFGPGLGIPTRTDGFMFYYEICETVVKESWKVFRDQNETMGPYAVSRTGKNRTWVGYDDPAMAVIKSKYILSKGLGGAAVLHVGMDDFRNKCGDGHYPMLKAIWNTLLANRLNQTLAKPLNSTTSTNNAVKIENLLFRQKIAFVFSLVISVLSCITIIYILYLLFQSTLKQKIIHAPPIYYNTRECIDNQ